MPSLAPSATAKPAVMLIHGLASSPLELQFLARNLRQTGYVVHLPSIRNYTLGQKDAAQQAAPYQAEDWLRDLRAELRTLHAQHGRVVIGGLCIGSVLALRLAQLEPDCVQGILALSTALHYDGWGNPWFTPLLPLARIFTFAKAFEIQEKSPFGVKDERMRAWLERQMRSAGRSDAGAASLRVGDLLHARALIAQVRQHLPEIQAPVLLIHARDDECASPRSAFEVASRVRSATVRCVLLDDCYHMISIDKQKEQVLQEIQAFLQSLQSTDCQATHSAELPFYDRANPFSTTVSTSRTTQQPAHATETNFESIHV